MEGLRVGIAGAAGRGASFFAPLAAVGARVHAVCDTRVEALDEAAARAGASEKYSDFAEMLERSDLDAVVIATPMHLHATQSIAALRRGLHVLSEVPAGVSIEECRELVLACRASKAVYMMAENYVYTPENALVEELARRGLFGAPYYAEGEYLHDVKHLAAATPWRRSWQLGVDGLSYPTHSLGPVLRWLGGDRIARLSCEGSGRHHFDAEGRPFAQDTSVMLGKTARGALVKIRVDLLSDRPHAMTNYQLQGTDGCYESARGGPDERGKLWLRALDERPVWRCLDSLLADPDFRERYVPEQYRHPPEEALRAGHGGGDYYVVAEFVRSAAGERAPSVGIHEAMDMTLPGLVSQASVARGGEWLDVPDSRSWGEPPPREQLHMIWPERLLGSPPVARVPEGYGLRTFREGDERGYLDLMALAGFEGWTAERLERVKKTVLPEGFFVVEHSGSGRLVATALAQHSPSELHPWGGEMGWVAADPAHRGKGLGLAVCAAATARLLAAGYRRIYLKTDDFRLNAIAVYLKLGYEPLMYRADMPARWQEVRAALARR